MTGSVMVSFVALGAMLRMISCDAGSQDRHHYDGLRSQQIDGEHCVGPGSQVVRATNYLIAQCPPPSRKTAGRTNSSAAPVAETLEGFVLVSGSPARLRPDELRSLQGARYM